MAFSLLIQEENGTTPYEGRLKISMAYKPAEGWATGGGDGGSKTDTTNDAGTNQRHTDGERERERDGEREKESMEI